MNHRRWKPATIAVALAMTLLGGCMTPAYQVASATPPTCVDSTYVRLKQQHPDSLSEREWQRLQTLDRQCAEARASQPHNRTGNHGAWMGLGHGAAIGIMTVMMVGMMIAMR